MLLIIEKAVFAAFNLVNVEDRKLLVPCVLHLMVLGVCILDFQLPHFTESAPPGLQICSKLAYHQTNSKTRKTGRI